MTAHESPENAVFTAATMTGARYYFKPQLFSFMTPEEQKKFTEQLGHYSKTNIAPFMLFAELTGPLPKAKGERQDILKQIDKLTKNNFFPYLINYLQYLQDCNRHSNLIAAYKQGTISPELLAILNDKYMAFPAEYRYMPEPEVLRKMYEEGKLNFEPFREEHDTEANWPFLYRVAFHILPTTELSLDKLVKLNEFTYRGTIEHIKTQVKILLEGEKPTPEMLERTDGNGADEYVIQPEKPENLTALAELIEGQYNRQIKENAALDFAAPFFTPAAAGFYINPQTCKIYDLRPHQKELHSLLSLKSWDYLRDFANAIREAIAEFTEPVKEEPAGEGILLSLFPDVYYRPTEEAKNFRNFAVSKAEKRIIAAYANAIINGQGITLTDSEGNPLQDVDFIDASGNRSKETIRPFDISIMNCVGSLQQKYPDNKGFTDIQIAREFCSTQDKKGHITPESPITLEVREAMQRLSIVYGRMDITEEIKREAQRRHPDKKKIDRLIKGSKRFAIAQPLVNVKKIAIQTLKNDKDTLYYIIEDPPLFYLHAAITHQIASVPFAQMNSKRNLTIEIRLLREQTRIALESAISMRENKKGGNTIRFNTIIDRTFRTSADYPENTDDKEITEVVKRIPEHIRWKLQRQIQQYLEELITHGVITGYTILKKNLPGKRKLVEYGFAFTLPESGGKNNIPQTHNYLPPNP